MADAFGLDVFFLQTPGWIALWIISSGAQKYNKSNLHVFLLHINEILIFSFKEVAKIKALWNFSAILEITQDALRVVVAQVQTLHFNVSFITKYTLI